MAIVLLVVSGDCFRMTHHLVVLCLLAAVMISACQAGRECMRASGKVTCPPLPGQCGPYSVPESGLVRIEDNDDFMNGGPDPFGESVLDDNGNFAISGCQSDFLSDPDPRIKIHVSALFLSLLVCRLCLAGYWEGCLYFARQAVGSNSRATAACRG